LAFILTVSSLDARPMTEHDESNETMKRSMYFSLICLMISGCNDSNFDNKEFDGITPALATDSVITTLGDQFVTAKGSWFLIGEKSSTPYNVTEIQCRRNLMSCRSAYAELQDYFGPPKLDVGQDIFDIAEWNEDGILIKSADGCREIETVISAKNQTVTQTIESNINLPTCVKDDSGKPYQPTLSQPRKLRMLNLKEFEASIGKN
jgi:hypothetical protein